VLEGTLQKVSLGEVRRISLVGILENKGKHEAGTLRSPGSLTI
jgi:hypothetical protein